MKVVCTIQGSRAASTRFSHSAKWLAFQRWCLDQGLDPLPGALLLDQLLMYRGLVFSTVKTYGPAISSCH